MKLDHVALYVLDLEHAKDFFIRYFNATSNNMYYNPCTGLNISLLLQMAQNWKSCNVRM